MDADVLRNIRHVGWMYPTGFLRDPDVHFDVPCPCGCGMTNDDIREMQREGY